MDPFRKTRTYILPVRVHAHTKPDCGNDKFAHAGRRGGRFACSLQRERDDTNAGNAYNHNFKDQWCYCDGPEALPMVQCLGCKDWYHQVGGCIHTHYNFDRDDFADGEDFLCQACLDVPELAFLHQYPAKPLADRPAWQPHAPQTPATPASGPGGPVVSPSPSSPPSVAADAAISSPSAAAMAVAEEGEGPEEGCCAVCHRPPVAGAPACLSSLVTCTGRRPPAVGEAAAETEAEDDDRKPSAQDEQEQAQEEEAMGGGACGRRYHPCCLPRGAAGVRDADGCVVGVPRCLLLC